MGGNGEVNAASERTVLLTGATGFVGRNVHEALLEAGWNVRCATRDVRVAEARWPDRTWVQLDVSDASSMASALSGCETALYLIHGMGSHADGFREVELRQADAFAQEAAAAGLRRIVYLGGVAAPSDASEHLRSREEVGEVLRAGDVPTVELRASMIVGDGSLSWLIVRDLAARLPVMILPSWLRSRTEPVSIDDITIALVRSLDLEVEGSTWFDVPGPDVLSGRDILERTASALGVARPLMIQVPFLSPRLSSHWVRFVTRAEWSVAREIVVGLKTDLVAQDDHFWAMIDHPDRRSFDTAARDAVEVESARAPLPGFWGWVERKLARMAKGASPASGQPASPELDVTWANRRAAGYGLAWLLGAWASNHLGIWISLSTTAVLLGAAILVFERASHWGNGNHVRFVIVGALVGLFMAAGTLLLFEPVTQAFPVLRADIAELYAVFRSAGLLAILMLMPLVVMCEELVWRGVIHGALVRRTSWPLALIAGSTLYAVAHVPMGSPALVLTSFGAGVCWNALRTYTDSLPAVMAAHLVWNFVVLVFFQLVP